MKPMMMTDREIRENWKHRSECPSKQVGVLADLNCVAKEEMRLYLEALGCDSVPKKRGGNMAKAQKPAKQTKVEEAPPEEAPHYDLDEDLNEDLAVVVREPEEKHAMTVGTLMMILSAVSDDAEVIIDGGPVTSATIRASYSGDGKAMSAYIELE